MLTFQQKSLSILFLIKMDEFIRIGFCTLACVGLRACVQVGNRRRKDTSGEKRKPVAFLQFGHGSHFYCGHKADAHIRQTSEASGIAPSHQRIFVFWFFADVDT